MGTAIYHPGVAPHLAPIAPADAANDLAARLGCERLHERTVALFARRAAALRCSVEEAALMLHHGADAVARWRAG